MFASGTHFFAVGAAFPFDVAEGGELVEPQPGDALGSRLARPSLLLSRGSGFQQLSRGSGILPDSVAVAVLPSPTGRGAGGEGAGAVAFRLVRRRVGRSFSEGGSLGEGGRHRPNAAQHLQLPTNLPI